MAGCGARLHPAPAVTRFTVATPGSNFSVRSNVAGCAVEAPRLTPAVVVNADPEAAPPLPASTEAGAPGAGVAGGVGVAVGLAVGLGVAEGLGVEDGGVVGEGVAGVGEGVGGAVTVSEPAERGYGHVSWLIERARAALAGRRHEQCRSDLDVAIERSSELGFTELQTYALLVLGAVTEIDDAAWVELQRKAAHSMWTEVFLGALEMDARRLARRDPISAIPRWRALLARSRELGYSPGAEEAEGWLLDEGTS